MVLVPSDQTSFRQPINVVDSDNVAVASLTYLSAITFFYKRPTDASWVEVTVVEGSSTYTEGGFRELDSGVYEFCWPDDAIVAGESTLVKYVYDSTDRIDVIDARLSPLTVSISREIIETLLANQDAGETPLITVGTRWSSSVTTDDITDATAIYYAVKQADEVDTAAVLLVRLPINGGGGDTGIVAVNGQTAAAASINTTDAVITSSVDGSDVTYTMTCEGEASALFPTTTTIERTSRDGYPRVTETSGYYTEWKLTGDNDRVLAQGRLKVQPGFVRATG